MSSMFCSLDEAFTATMPSSAKHLSKMKRRKVENFVAPSAPSVPDRQTTPLPAPEVLQGPTSEEQRPADQQQSLEGGGLQDFFPLPGDTAGSDEWAKAFTLEPSAAPGIPAPRFDGSVSVAGKSTLWRQISAPPVAPNEPAPAAGPQSVTMSAIPSDITQRLDTLTRQLESLTMPTPMQSTAELFLFVAIGLLLLLAIDTLLRFATQIAERSVRVAASGVSSAVKRGGGGGRRIRVRA